MTARERTPWRRLATQLRTPDATVSCGLCLEELPLFVNDEMAGRTVDDLYPAIADHLEVCSNCLKAYVALSRLLREAFSEDSVGE